MDNKNLDWKKIRELRHKLSDEDKKQMEMDLLIHVFETILITRWKDIQSLMNAKGDLIFSNIVNDPEKTIDNLFFLVQETQGDLFFQIDEWFSVRFKGRKVGRINILTKEIRFSDFGGNFQKLTEEEFTQFYKILDQIKNRFNLPGNEDSDK